MSSNHHPESSPRRGDCQYCPFYCEENIWHLAQSPLLPDGDRHVAFITGRAGSAVFFEQRAGEGGPMLWDYHVVLLVAGVQAGPQVYDLDTRLPFPTPLRAYVERTFGEQARLRPEYRACFRVMPAAAYVEGFSTDRSHMRDEAGGWLQPPPTWAPPSGTGVRRFALSDALNLAGGPAPGEWMDVRGLLARFSR